MQQDWVFPPLAIVYDYDIEIYQKQFKKYSINVSLGSVLFIPFSHTLHLLF